MKKINYAVLGSGRQGVAAAYDLAKNGNANKVILIDINIELAKSGSVKINKLLNTNIVKFDSVDVLNEKAIIKILEDIDVFISAVPYHLNLKLTQIAIKANSSMVDLGGHTENVKEQLKFSKEAKQKNITIVPDCGMGPGMNVSMALLGMEQLEKTSEVRIWDGGLPQNPLPPWNYNLFFHINGLTNEYDGSAYFLKNKKINRVKCFENIEIINLKDFKIPFEAAVTSGGLSTMPWTFENQLDILENKTLRYLGHWEWMKAYRELGLFEENKINFRGFEIVPREFYHHLLKPKLDKGIIEDVCLMKVECIGYLNGIKTKNIIECVEYFDKDTGFSAMEKWTGWHASIVAIEIAKNKIPNGAIPIEKALSGSVFYDNSKIRNYNINFHSEEIL
tara:strand:+ start:338 stop:1513 length:1176 start_codon:yes stop_codon:yes gene_type:complete